MSVDLNFCHPAVSKHTDCQTDRKDERTGGSCISCISVSKECGWSTSVLVSVCIWLDFALAFGRSTLMWMFSHPLLFYWTCGPLCLRLATFCFALRYVSSLQKLLLYFLLYFVALCGSVRHLRTTFTFVCTQYRRLHLDFPSTILTAAHRGVCYGVSPLPFHISSCHLGYPVCLSVGIDCVVLLSPCFCFACPCHSNVLGSH